MKSLKLTSAYKDYLWGGTQLKTKYGKKTSLEKVAESWELSCHDDGLSIISSGEFDGISLKQFLKDHPQALGTTNATNELPILIKLIDAADNLSIQVHPNNKQAKEWENQNGKTEMWYVMETTKDAKIVYGVKNDITKDELRKSILDNSVIDKLDCVESKKGDVFFVEAGTIHAIGKGNIIAEIQQNSNVTYRLYDYDRRDKNGNPRELHIKKGIDCSNTNKTEVRSIPLCSDNTKLLGSCEYFQVKEIKINKAKQMECYNESYQALIAVEGNVTINFADHSQNLTCGETLFIPAGTGKYTIEGKGVMLMASNPPKYYIGVDLGGTNIATAVVDEYGIIYGRANKKTNIPRPYNEVLDDMIDTIFSAVKNSGLKMEYIENIGVGCPGALNRKEGMIEFSNNLDFHDVPIVEYLKERLNKEIYIENDANAAAWGEFLAGTGKEYKNMIMLTLGTGIGGGIIIDGKIFRGAYEQGAEIGHMAIIADGKKCTCGRKGCFEAYASATALIKQTKEKMKENKDSELWKIVKGKLSNVEGKTVFMAKNDKTAKEVLNNYLKYLSCGVVDVVNLFQPEVVCIGGGISKAGQRIIKPIEKAIKKESFARFGKKQSIVKLAHLNNDAGIIGAALLYKNED